MEVAGSSFWSEDRREFIPAVDIRLGETLNVLNSLARVASVESQRHSGFVYNLETTEHVYRVGSLATLVHNASDPTKAGDVLDRLQEAKRQFQKNKDFRNWAHKEFMEDIKMGGGGKQNPDIPDSMIADAYDEWLELGKPKR